MAYIWFIGWQSRHRPSKVETMLNLIVFFRDAHGVLRAEPVFASFATDYDTYHVIGCARGAYETEPPFRVIRNADVERRMEIET